ncbi:LiaI-LiaF-like domain-containing protein [Desulfosporosinus sp. SB140]|uniref:LiaI-LiaF-like domain-containing protein n=1 Tax=Desulfosporosinus paludis TaxID=3115649 RepID=UPI00388DCC64
MRRGFDPISRGLLLITLGIVFLLINYGLLSWSFWVHVVDLWPLILILAGIGLLFNRRIPFSAVLLVFLLCMVVYSLVLGDRPMPWSINTPFQSSATKEKPFNVPLPSDVEKANNIQ